MIVNWLDDWSICGENIQQLEWWQICSGFIITLTCLVQVLYVPVRPCWSSRWARGRMPQCTAPCWWTRPPAWLPPHLWSAGTGRRQDRVLSCWCPSGQPTPPPWPLALGSIAQKCLWVPVGLWCCVAQSWVTQQCISVGWWQYHIHSQEADTVTNSQWFVPMSSTRQCDIRNKLLYSLDLGICFY